jgi:gluconokinase
LEALSARGGRAPGQDDPGRTTTVVLMGPSGCGKTTVMRALAARVGWATAEGDDFHPRANVEKMAAGHPLTDQDRGPWLDAMAAWIGEREAARQSAIVTCSALRRAYRDRLRSGHPSTWFAELVVPEAELGRRVRLRQHRYMPASLLASQLETLEPLEGSEPGIRVDADRPPDRIVDEIVSGLPGPTSRS